MKIWICHYYDNQTGREGAIVKSNQRDLMRAIADLRKAWRENIPNQDERDGCMIFAPNKVDVPTDRKGFCRWLEIALG